MSAQRMHLIETYNKYYTKFLLCVKKHGGSSSPSILIFKTETNSSGIIQRLKEPIILSQWPVKKEKPSKNVDISVYASDHYDKDRHHITKSSVSLSYFKRDTINTKSELFANIRFDYHPDADDKAHPLIHAHLFSKELDAIPKFGKCETILGDIKSNFNDFRLPVPNMSLPSVLLNLVACHFNCEAVTFLLNNTQDIDIPKFNITENQLDLLKSDSLAGSQWFKRAT